MKFLFCILFIVLIAGCRSLTKKKPADQTGVPADTTISLRDSGTGFVEYNFGEDSIRAIRERDSFYAISPILKLIGEDASDQLDALLMDTTEVTQTLLQFNSEWKHDYDKDSFRINRYSVFTNPSYKIKVTVDNKDDARRIFINDRELRPGKNLDTSLAGDWWLTSFEVAEDVFYEMKFANKKYLLITGYVHMCNGLGCGIGYYLLYDPSTHKGMVLEQFRSEFIGGYDKKTRSPVFIKTGEGLFNDIFQAFILSGKCYRWDVSSGKVKKYTDSKGKQYYYDGYWGRNDDTLKILKGHFQR